MDNDLFSVKGKVVIITGGGQGIGEFLALGLSKRGAIVYCIDKKFKKSKNRDGLHDMPCDITKIDKISPPVIPSKIMTVLLRRPKGVISPNPTVENTTTLK